uniref:Uncharacterized protein n=1 Tax=Percolomonas cosmopolitus TaxID=63605 RepID=A0A7S1KLJ8_9EUKA
MTFLSRGLHKAMFTGHFTKTQLLNRTKWVLMVPATAYVAYVFLRNEDPLKQFSQVPLIESNTPQPLPVEEIRAWWESQRATIEPYWTDVKLRKQMTEHQRMEIDFLKGEGFLQLDGGKKPYQQ